MTSLSNPRRGFQILTLSLLLTLATLTAATLTPLVPPHAFLLWVALSGILLRRFCLPPVKDADAACKIRRLSMGYSVLVCVVFAATGGVPGVVLAACALPALLWAEYAGKRVQPCTT